jgi:hypothetical protein
MEIANVSALQVSVVKTAKMLHKHAQMDQTILLARMEEQLLDKQANVLVHVQQIILEEIVSP